MNILNRQFVRAPFYTFERIEQVNSKYELLEFYRNNASFQKAIYLASPKFYSVLESALHKDRVSDKLTITLLKYLLRASSKCTPFGLFSGFTITEHTDNLKKESPIIFDELRYTEIQRLSNVSLNKLFSITPIKEESQSNFKLNETFFKAGNHAMYHEQIDISDFNSDFIKSSIEINEVIEHLMLHVRDYLSFQKLNKLIKEIIPDSTDSEVNNYLKTLINNQILVSDTRLPLTGSLTYYRKLAHKRLFNLNCEYTSIELTDLQKANRKIDQHLNTSSSNYFHIDFKFDKKGKLSDEYGNKLIEILPFIYEFFRPIDRIERLGKFKASFNLQFGEQFIPINKALDKDTGIPYGPSEKYQPTNFLNEDLIIYKNRRLKVSEDALKEIEKIILQKIVKNPNSTVLHIDDLGGSLKINAPKNKLPQTLFAFTKIGKKYIYLDFFGGPTASKLINRFSFDSEVKDLIREIYSIEDQNSEEEITCELVHTSMLSNRNIATREVSRKYEVELLSRSQSEHPIKLGDILVGVENDEIKIKHRKTGANLNIIDSTALFADNDPLSIYWFLMDMANNKTYPSMGFSWPDFFQKSFEFLPRIQYNDVVLSLSQWNLNKAFIDKIKETNDLLDLFKKKGIDTKFFLYNIVTDELQILIDLEKRWHQTLFKNEIKNKDFIIIKECFFTEDNPSIIQSEKGGSYNNEFLFFFKKDKKIES